MRWGVVDLGAVSRRLATARPIWVNGVRSLSVGDSAEIRRRFTAEDVANFARLSGDDNPIHLDAEYAKNSIFGRCVLCSVLRLMLLTPMISL